MSTILDALKPYRHQLAVAELGILLHDLDKQTKSFLDKPAVHGCYDKIGAGVRSSDGRAIRLRQMLPTLFDALQSMDIELPGIPATHLECWSDKTKDERQRPIIAEFTDPTHSRYKAEYANMNWDLRSPVTPSWGSPWSAALHHHAGQYVNDLPVLAVLAHGSFGGADGIDSSMDKNVPNGVGTQDQEPFRIDTPFGTHACQWSNETTPIGDFDTWCISVLPDLPDHLQEVRERLWEFMRSGLGETRFPCNDVTLWAHSRSVALLYRALMIKIIMECQLGRPDPFSPDSRYRLPVRTPGDGDNATDYTYMRIAFDRQFLISRAQKAGDVAGIDYQIHALQDAMADFVEDKCMVGGETYRDEASVVFLLPRLSTWISEDGTPAIDVDLHQRFEADIRDALVGKIEYHLQQLKALDFPFAIDFAASDVTDLKREVDVGRRLIARGKELLVSIPAYRQSVRLLSSITSAGNSRDRCQVCQLRLVGPMAPAVEENLCNTCFGRRRSDPDVRKHRRELSDLCSTINLEECKTEGGNRLALLCLSFDPEPIISGEVFAYTKVGKESKHPSLGRIHRSWEATSDFLTSILDAYQVDLDALPVFVITLSPVRLEVVIAAERIWEMVHYTYQQYERQFGKFRPLLPLHIGAIVFQHKFPLYLIMETSVRLFTHLQTESKHDRSWTVVAPLSDTSQPGELRLTSSPFARRSPGTLPVCASWRIDPRRSVVDERYQPPKSDPGIDTWHAYWPLVSEGQNSAKLAHMLETGDTFCGRDGAFDFVLMDGVSSRHDLREGQHHHHVSGPRPAYPLSAIPLFARLERLIAKLGKTQAKAIELQLTSQMHRWGDLWWSSNLDPGDIDVVREYCRTVVMAPHAWGKRRGDLYANLDNSDPHDPANDIELLVGAAANGMLLDALDLFLRLTRSPAKQSHLYTGSQV